MPAWVSIEDRLERNSTPEPNSGCRLWLGAVDKDGYGQMKVGCVTKRAHRLSWQTHKGPIPDGLCTLHKCDVRSCIEPEHLFLGTDLDNARDRDAKGRQASGDRNGSRLHPESRPRGDANPSRRRPERLARGGRHGMAKLTEAQVREILLSSESKRKTAKRFNVSPSLVTFIRNRTIWKHVSTERIHL